MNRGKSPPVDLDKYLVGKEHRYCTYQDGARLYSMAYWSFVTLAKEAKANIKLRKTALGCDEPDRLDYSLATALVNIITILLNIRFWIR